YLTPVVTIVITCLTMAMVILFLDVERIAKLASAFMVMMFISVNICVIILRETSAQWYNPSYKSPLYPYVQIFGIVTGIILLILLGLVPFLIILAIFVLGFIIYYYYGKTTARKGVLRKYGHRPALYLLYQKKGSEKRGNQNLQAIDPSFLDGKIASEAGVVIPLLGNEYSPEMLAEIGAALNKKEIIQAVHIKEVPNQTFLEAVMDNNPKINALARRFSGLAKAKNIKIDFEAVVTHDLTTTIQELSNQSHCDWMVMGWDGRAHKGILIRNPIGWFVSHVHSDFALFKDNGVRYIGKVLLALRPGRKEKDFIAIANRVSQFYNASLTLLHVVSDDMDEQTIQAIASKSKQHLLKVNSTSEVIIQRSDDPIESISKISADYDLLIIGTPEKDQWKNVLFGKGKDKFADSSACSVLRLTMKD
ncbi:MAG: hypothetical protein OEM04_13070, partial [Flavobacteriaceae bacterium]|nr:hypothetical protein [Flavobacteriaceae bacterium]